MKMMNSRILANYEILLKKLILDPIFIISFDVWLCRISITNIIPKTIGKSTTFILAVEL
jgi:hypothetical protein